MIDDTSGKTSTSSIAGLTADRLSGASSDVAGRAKDLGAQAAATAHDVRDKAAETGADLLGKAKDMASDAGDHVSEALEDQKQAGADWAGGISDAIRRAAGELEHEMPPAAGYIRRAADEIDNVVDAVRRRDVRQLVSDVQDFARRQPTAFLGATVLGGFALVRLLKTSTSETAATTTGTPGTRVPRSAGASFDNHASTVSDVGSRRS